jgi:hypothetical protein
LTILLLDFLLLGDILSVKPIKFIKPIIDHYLSNRLDNVDRKTGCFHPSSLTKCSLLLYEEYLKESLASTYGDPRVKRIFDNGRHVHTRLQGYCKEIGILIDEDVPIHDDKYEICGEIDGLLKFWDELVVMDVKSINKANFQNLITPSLGYIIQLNVYLYCLGLKYGILFYECKDDQEMHEFLIEYNPSILIPIFKKIKYVQDCIKTKTIPVAEECDYCKWCDRKDTCNK